MNKDRFKLFPWEGIERVRKHVQEYKGPWVYQLTLIKLLDQKVNLASLEKI